jgi:hypothetical protein
MPKNRIDAFGNHYITGSYDEVSMTTGSLNFNNAQSQYLSVAHSAALNITSGDFTIELWAYFNDVTNSGIILNKDGVFNASYPQYSIAVGSGTVGVQLGNGAGISPTVSDYSVGSVAVGQWYHIAVVRTGSTIKTFLNGVQGVSTTQGTAMSDGGKPLLIGIQSGFSNYFNGSISNLRILKGTALYTNSFTPPIVPLDPITNTSLLLKASSLATATTDSSATPATITNVNNVAFNSQGPFNNLPCGSIYFNGSSQYLSTPSNTAFAFGTGDYTVECWVYPVDTTSGRRIFQFSDDNDNLDLNIAGAGYISYYNGATSTNSSSAVVTLNAWNHIAMVRASGTVRVYVNGILAITQATTPNTASARILNIAGATNVWFNGHMTNIRVVKGTAIYTANFTPPTSVLQPITNTSLLLQVANSSAYITDSSTNALTVTNNGTAVYKQFAPITTLRQRVTNDGSMLLNTAIDEMTLSTGSLLFNGSNQKLTVPAGSAFAYGTGDFTVEGWFYTDSYASNPILFSQTTSGSNYFLVVLTTSGQLQFWGGHTTILITTTATFPLNRWNHFAVVRSSGTTKLYVNGVSDISSAASYNFTDTSYVPTIGTYSHTGSQYFSGNISNFRIVKGTAVYTSNFTPPTVPLEAITNTSFLLKNANLAAATTDSSTNALTVTNTNNVAFNYQSPFNDAPCGSILFNGSSQHLSLAASSSFDITSGNFTVELWIYRTVSGAEQYLWSSRSDSPSSGWEWRINATNLMQLFFTGGSSLTSTGTIPVNTWTHLAVTRETNTVRFFINGVQDSSATFSNGTAISGVGLFIGYGTTGGGRLTGYMTNARIIKGTALYNGSFTPPSSVLQPITNTQLLLQVANSSSYITDSSTNAFTVTNNGTATYRQFAPLIGSKQRLDYTGTHYIANTYNELLLNYGSVYFPNSSYAFTATMPSLNSNNFTIEAWINMSNTVTEAPLVKYIATDILEMRLVSGKLVSFYNNGAGGTITDGGTLANSTWYHVALVRNGSTLTQYVNGVANGTPATISGTTNATAVYIGRNQTAGGANFNGSMYNLKISNTAIYTGNFTPSTLPLTSNSSTHLLMFNGANSSNYTLNTGYYSNIVPAMVSTVPFHVQNPFNDQPCGSLGFNGSSQYLTLSGVPVATTGQFTIEAWVYTTTSATQLIYSQYLASNGNRWQFSIDNVSGYKLTLGHNAGGTLASTNIVPLNQWNHVAVTRDASNTLRLFLNGNLEANSTGYTFSMAQDNPRVSGFSGVGTYNFNGFMTNIRIANTALYTSSFTPPTTVLQAVANTTFLLKVANSSAYITDSSTSAITSTNNGTVLYRQFAHIAN